MISKSILERHYLRPASTGNGARPTSGHFDYRKTPPVKKQMSKIENEDKKDRESPKNKNLLTPVLSGRGSARPQNS